MLLEDALIRETKAIFSDITRDFENARWVRSEAREVNIMREYDTVLSLAKIMTFLRQKYNWAAVSSNNIHWNMTPDPIRVIQIPDPEHYLGERDPLPRQYLTVVNPSIVSSWGKYHVDSGEGCGSLGEAQIIANRHNCIRITGYIVEEEKTREIITKNPLLTANIEHEIDHLDGVAISDKGPVYFLAPRGLVIDPHAIGVLGYVSSLFGTVWPTKDWSSDNQIIYFKDVDRIALADKQEELLPTLTFVLMHEETRPFWEIHEEKIWARYIRKETIFPYGKPITFEFPDTPVFRHFLSNIPSLKSRYKFWDIPIKNIEQWI